MCGLIMSQVSAIGREYRYYVDVKKYLLFLFPYNVEA